MLNGLSLFSGIGGIELALNEWVRPIAYCEIDAYCQAVLLSRMVSGDIAEAPIWDDIKTLRLQSFDATIDIFYGGFPCQDISVAGLGKGLEGKRSGLFFEIMRLAKEIKPKFIFLENVPAITSRGGLQVVREIAEMGYDCRFCVISAASVGALHRRERWFLLAQATGQSADEHAEREAQAYSLSGNSGDDGNSDGQPSEQANTCAESKPGERHARRGSTGQHWPFESREHWQEAVSSVCRTVDGVSARLDYNTPRLKALGNSVVNQQVKEAFKILMGLE